MIEILQHVMADHEIITATIEVDDRTSLPTILRTRIFTDIDAGVLRIPEQSLERLSKAASARTNIKYLCHATFDRVGICLDETTQSRVVCGCRNPRLAVAVEALKISAPEQGRRRPG